MSPSHQWTAFCRCCPPPHVPEPFRTDGTVVTSCYSLARVLSSMNAALPSRVFQTSLNPMRARLDVIDWRILKELQADGRVTNVALARRVGISAPPCLRRVRALEEAGFITGYHAQVDEQMLGFELTAFVMVGLHSQAEPDLRDFENRVLGWPLEREDYLIMCYTVNVLNSVLPGNTTI